MNRSFPAHQAEAMAILHSSRTTSNITHTWSGNSKYKPGQISPTKEDNEGNIFKDTRKQTNTRHTYVSSTYSAKSSEKWKSKDLRPTWTCLTMIQQYMVMRKLQHTYLSLYTKYSQYTRCYYVMTVVHHTIASETRPTKEFYEIHVATQYQL